MRSLGFRIGLSMFALVLFSVVLGGLSVAAFNAMSGAAAEAQAAAAELDHVGELQAALKDLQVFPTDYAALGNKGNQEEYTRAKARVEDLLQKLSAGAAGEREQGLYAEMRQILVVTYRNAEAILAEKNPVGNRALTTQLRELDYAMVRARGVSFQARNLAEERATTAVAYSLAMKQTVQWVLIAGIAISIIVGALMTLMLSRSVSVPARNLVRMAQAVAAGDWTQQAAEGRNDELGQISRAFNEMVRSVRTLISAVVQTSQAVGVAAAQSQNETGRTVAAAAEASRGTTQIVADAVEQARTIGDVTTFMAELRRAVDQIADGAQSQASSVQTLVLEANGVAQEADRMKTVVADATNAGEAMAERAQRGGSVVAESVQTMGQVATSVDEAVARIRSLAEQTSQVGQILEVIRTLSEQTNLLALNAAIEAARAGEHGRGFAVVAEEVRKLAGGAAKSVDSIGQILVGIQRGTQDVIEAMEKANAVAARGGTYAAEAGTALSDILAMVRETQASIAGVQTAADRIHDSTRLIMDSISNLSSLTEEYLASTEEMAAGSEEVSQGMHRIEATTQRGVNAARETAGRVTAIAAANEQIAAQTDDLMQAVKSLEELVARFKV